MRTTICIVATLAALTLPATALPIAPADAYRGGSNLIEVKGGHGHGHGWGRGGHSHGAFGWSRGRKVGWRGHHCPPGHWKKGWC